ncbi:MAG TPA: hypothetical protein VKX17_08370 [Planctomycetota bacterium]|nr:hypothetical protein [Planctomycetota bacterium]
MSRSIKPVLFACIALIAAVSIRAADEPKDVAVAFAKAITEGDKKATHEVAAGTEEQLKTLDLMTDMLHGILKFKAACDAKFGAENVLSKSMAGGVPDLVDEVKKSEAKEEGDTVTFIDKAKPDDKHPLKLKKVDGKWKVDLSSMGDEAKDMPAGMGKMFGDFADEINAGKYKTAEEAAVAFQKKMQPPAEAK